MKWKRTPNWYKILAINNLVKIQVGFSGKPDSVRLLSIVEACACQCLPEKIRMKIRNRNDLKYETTPKSHFTPKSPKGDFCKMLIFSSPTLGAGGKKDKNQHFMTSQSGLKYKILK